MLLELFQKHSAYKLTGDVIHYADAYERYFLPSRRTVSRVLEIGVFEGGSLRAWKEFFPRAEIMGLDINPRCKVYEEDRIAIEIGKQQDLDFLEGVVAKHGPFDIVIDDGGHLPEPQIETFKFLFPKMAFGGFYVIEDLHTSYHPKYGGSLRGPGTCIEFLKGLVDSIHPTSHESGGLDCRGKIDSIHFHKSICFVEKSKG